MQKTKDKMTLMTRDEEQYIDTFREMAEENPDDVYLLLCYARQLGRRNQLDVAIEIIDRIKLLDPENVDRALLEAWLYAKKGQRQDAINTLMVIPTSNLDITKFSTVMGYLEFYKGDFDSSTKYLTVAVKDAPENLIVRLTLADAYIQLRQYNHAHSIALEAVTQSPNHEAAYGAYYSLAIAEEKLGNYNSARTYYEEVIKRKPNDLRYYKGLFHMLLRRGKFISAISLLKKAIRHNVVD